MNQNLQYTESNFYTDLLTKGVDNNDTYNEIQSALGDMQEIDGEIMLKGFKKAFRGVLSKVGDNNKATIRANLERMDKELEELDGLDVELVYIRIEELMDLLEKKAEEIGGVDKGIYSFDMLEEVVGDYQGNKIQLMDVFKKFSLLSKKLDFIESLQAQTNEVVGETREETAVVVDGKPKAELEKKSSEEIQSSNVDYEIEDRKDGTKILKIEGDVYFYNDIYEFKDISEPDKNGNLYLKIATKNSKDVIEYKYIMININKSKKERIISYKNNKGKSVKEFGHIGVEKVIRDGEDYLYYHILLNSRDKTIKELSSNILVDQDGNIDTSPLGEVEFYETTENTLIRSGNSIKVDWDGGQKQTSQINGVEILDNELKTLEIKGKKIKYQEGADSKVITDFIEVSKIGKTGTLLVTVKKENRKNTVEYVYMVVNIDGDIIQCKNNAGINISGYKNITQDEYGYCFYLREKDQQYHGKTAEDQIVIMRTADIINNGAIIENGHQIYNNSGDKTEFLHRVDNFTLLDDGVTSKLDPALRVYFLLFLSTFNG